MSALNTEEVRSDLFLTQEYTHQLAEETTPLPQWYTEIQMAFDKSIILDRHYLLDIESSVRIAHLVIVDAQSDKPLTDYGNDYVQLILTRDCNLSLNFRELPVALLRLHFTGHDRFMMWLRRVPHTDLCVLAELARRDLRYTPKTESIQRDDYQHRLTQVYNYLVVLIDWCFCSFERTLHAFLTNRDRWPSCGLRDAMATDSHWANFPALPIDAEHTSVMWYVCLWRWHVSRLVEKYLKPWRVDGEQEEWVTYRMRLFRASHLDFVTMVIRKRAFSDESLVKSRLLYKYYPSAHRICCAEELPCLVEYTYDNSKTGSNLKERHLRKDRIGHIVTNKPMPNICKVRNVHKIIRRYGNHDKLIFDLIKHIARCVLLGNMPNTKGALDIMAAVRINMSFSDEIADTVITKTKEEAEAMKKKKKTKKKTKTTTKKTSGDNDEEDGDEDDDEDDDEEKDETLFTRWLYKCRHFVLFILKEFLFYTVESSGCFDKIMSGNNKWCQHKDIVRAGMGRCRDDLSWQCKNTAYDTAIDWTRIEYIYKKDDYDIKTGIVMKVHTSLLKTTEKVKKDSFENILMKKMTSIEEEISLDESIAQMKHPFESLVDPEHPDAPDVAHVITCEMVTCNEDIMPTRWFQVLGMTSRGLSRLRHWIFSYYEYNIPDNALKKWIIAFQRDSMSDYIILKTTIKLILYYKKDHIYHLPSSYAVRQTTALRRLLCIDPLHATPPLLGIHYMCPGCLRFANPVINPLDYDTPIATPATAKKKTNARKKNKTENENKEAEKSVDTSEESAPQSNVNIIAIEDDEDDGPDTMMTDRTSVDEASHDDTDDDDDDTKKAKKNKPSTTPQNVPYFNNALYDLNTGHVHCHRHFKKKKALVTYNSEEPRYVIIRGRKNGVIIETNIDRNGEDHPLDEMTAQHMATSDEDDFGDDDDDDDDDDDMVTFNHEDELFFMPDASFNIDSQWDRMNRIAAHTTGGLHGGDDAHSRATAKRNAAMHTKVNNNKTTISRIVDTVFHRKCTCASPLIPVDMIGVIVNGNALCVDCGCMTEVHGSNLHSHGITCMRHATPSFPFDHPVWKVDRSAAKLHARYYELMRPADALTGVPGTKEASSCGIATKKHRQTEHYHPIDLVHQPYGATEHNFIKCHFCSTMTAIVSVTAITRSSYRLVKKPICYSCRHLCKSYTMQGNTTFLDILERHVYQRNQNYVF